jgi:hypothetical protein
VRNGEKSITLPAELLALDIEVTSDGHCGEQLALLEPGREPRPIEMRSGANVIGRLVLDGQPVAGMSIAVVQLERGAGTGIFVAAVGAVTDKDGRFEFQYLPPDQRYCIYSLAGDAKRTQSPHILTTKCSAAAALPRALSRAGSRFVRASCPVTPKRGRTGPKPRSF